MCQSLHLQDIQLMRSLGIRNFRMSLAWSRLFPNGTGQLNQAGVDCCAFLDVAHTGCALRVGRALKRGTLF